MFLPFLAATCYLAILSPGKGMRRHNDALGRSMEVKVDSGNPLIQRAIAWYQGASYGFSHRLLAWQVDNSPTEQHAALPLSPEATVTP